MSVINEMLQDLDKRKDQEVAGAGGAAVQSAGRNSRPVIVGLLSVIAILLVVLGIVLSGFYNRHQTVAPVVAAPAESGVVQRAEPAAVVAPSPAEVVAPSVGSTERVPEILDEPVANPETSSNDQPAALPTLQPKASETQSRPQSTVQAQPTAEKPVGDTDRNASVRSVPAASAAEERAPVAVVESPPPKVEKKAMPSAPAEKRQAAVAPATPMKVSNAVEKRRVLSPEQRDQQVSEKAVALFDAGNLAEAEAILRRHIATQPATDLSRIALSELYFQESRWDEAEQVLQEGLNKHTAKTLAQLQVMLHRPIDALETLNQNAPSMDEDPSHYVLTAELYRRLEQYESSAMLYGRLLQYDPEIADWWVGFGIALEGQGRTADARIAYETSLEKERLHPQLRDFVLKKLGG